MTALEFNNSFLLVRPQSSAVAFKKSNQRGPLRTPAKTASAYHFLPDWPLPRNQTGRVTLPRKGKLLCGEFPKYIFLVDGGDVSLRPKNQHCRLPAPSSCHSLISYLPIRPQFAWDDNDLRLHAFLSNIAHTDATLFALTSQSLRLPNL
jgi:hypothetical protein